MDNITHLPNPKTLAQSFAEDIWSEHLGNSPSAALVQGWTGLFKAFNECIALSHNPTDKPLHQVIPLPTGTGKTQATLFYLKHLKREGALIVTFFKDEADKLAQGIPYAKAYHSDNRLTTEIIDSTQVLVITHSQYLNCINDPTSHFKLYQGKPRTLTIIDESLSNIKAETIERSDIQSAITKVTLLKIHNTKPEQDKAYTDELNYLKALINILDSADPDKVKPQGSILNPEQMQGLTKESSELKLLKAAVKDKKTLLSYDNTTDLKKLSDLIRKLENLDTTTHLIISTKAQSIIINSCEIIDSLKDNTVILDATASIEKIYQLKENTIVKTIPQHIRSYSNVTLHLSDKLYNNSKSGFKNTTPDHLQNDVTYLIESLYPDTMITDSDMIEMMFMDSEDSEAKQDHYKKAYQERSLLIISNKTISDQLRPITNSLQDYAPISVDHWGNLTGKNDYKDYSKIIILTLPFKPEIHTSYLHSSTQRRGSSLPIYPATEVNNNKIREERTTIKYTNMAAELIQAINRIQCRNVIDDKGNCKPTDIYLFQNTNENVNTAIIDSIEQQMPDINVITSPMLQLKESLKEGSKGGRPSEHIPLIIDHLQHHVKAYPVKLNDIATALNIKKSSINNLTKKKHLYSDTGLDIELKDKGYRLYKNRSYYIGKI